MYIAECLLDQIFVLKYTLYFSKCDYFTVKIVYIWQYIFTLTNTLFFYYNVTDEVREWFCLKAGCENSFLSYLKKLMKNDYKWNKNSIIDKYCSFKWLCDGIKILFNSILS